MFVSVQMPLLMLTLSTSEPKHVGMPKPSFRTKVTSRF